MFTRIFLDLHTPPALPPLVLTIGNFDGVHLGHQAMLGRALSLAKQLNKKTAVMVFEPQPKEFFSPDTAPARLSNLDEKTALIEESGVDYLLVAKFDEYFRTLTAKDFSDFLKKLGVVALILGDDFRFGQGRTGDGNFLKAEGFLVEYLSTVTENHARVSSTAIRDALASGDLAAAKQLLGRDYLMMGQVMHGDKIGRTLDFPTANIALERLKPALHGVFGVDVRAVDGQPLTGGVAGIAEGSLFGCANIGLRPSVGGQTWRLEVHLPDFSGDLYGRTLQVTFLHFLHGEKKYDSLDALKAGIFDDVRQLLAWRADQTA